MVTFDMFFPAKMPFLRVLLKVNFAFMQNYFVKVAIFFISDLETIKGNLIL